MGYIARNEKGQLGLVLGHHFNHKNGGKPYNYFGIGLRGGNWKSKKPPIWVCETIADLIRDYKSIKLKFLKDQYAD